MPNQDKLTIQQAADILFVSRSFVIEQIQCGAIPYCKDGFQWRLLRHDVMEYKRSADEVARRAADFLTSQAQEWGMYD